jgi:hypothetical protein
MPNKSKDDFMMCFFDCDTLVLEDGKVTEKLTLAAKKDNLRYTDNFTIFKVVQNNARESL